MLGGLALVAGLCLTVSNHIRFFEEFPVHEPSARNCAASLGSQDGDAKKEIWPDGSGIPFSKMYAILPHSNPDRVCRLSLFGRFAQVEV